MEGLPKADELTALFSVVALGFVARAGFRSQFYLEKEEQAITILWALFWSAILSGAFRILGKPIPTAWLDKAHLAQKDAKLLVPVFNLVWAWALGTVWGKLQRARSVVDRDRVQGAVSGVRVPFWIAAKTISTKTRLHTCLSHDFLSNFAVNKWVIVELTDGRGYLGSIVRFDMDPARHSDFHLLLGYPSTYNPSTGASSDKPICEAMLIHASQVKQIKLLDTAAPAEKSPWTKTKEWLKKRWMAAWSWIGLAYQYLGSIRLPKKRPRPPKPTGP